MKYIDVHAHYDDEKYNEDIEQVLKDLKEVNIEYIINAGSGIDESKKALEIAKKHKNIYCTIGIHPYYTDQINKISELEKLYIQNKDLGKIVAIGEIGLDYHEKENNKDEQRELFKKQIRLAKKLNLPIQIHSRDAAIDTIQVLKEEPLPDKIMFHCFDLNEETAKHIIKNKWSVSVGGNITYKRSEQSLKVLKKIPIEQIMVETDSPYLSPEGHRGERNSSKNIPQIVRRLAKIKEMDERDVAEAVYNNATSFYNLK